MKITDIIKDKLNILDVVGSYVKLESSGSTYKGKSPFTNEKTPSFFVSPEKGFFYCFSSGKGGDIFTFIMEIERVDFHEALRILAERAGVSLKQQDSSFQANQGHVHDRLYRLLDDATKWYEVQLRKTKPVVEHLLSRGLTKDTLIRYRIGYAPSDWEQIYRYLRSKKYTDADIEAAGMIKPRTSGNTGYYDRFRSRIMFPLFDARGRVVGFSGRIYTLDASESQEAKYLNSPESPLFNKSELLYGYHIAKTEISKKGYVILVEGQFDVLLSQQSGYPHTVAISGTGLTEQHIAHIQRFTDTIYFALDADNAGIKATRRSVLVAFQQGMHVRVISMPAGLDPADTISRSVEQWEVCVRDAKDYISYRLEIHARTQQSFEEKQKFVHEDIFPFIAGMRSAITQDMYLQKISLFLGVSVTNVHKDFARFVEEEQAKIIPEQVRGNSSSQTLVQENPREHILYMYAYLKEEAIPIPKEIAELQEARYYELYGASLDDDLAGLDTTQKNIKLFVYKEQQKNTPYLILQNAVLTRVTEEYIKDIERKSKDLLARIRNAEFNKDTNAIHALQAEHSRLLQLKDSLMNT